MWYYSIHTIPDECFEDLHSLEWLKLWNNELTSLSYSLMEPILDTLKHLDIHSKLQLQLIFVAVCSCGNCLGNCYIQKLFKKLCFRPHYRLCYRTYYKCCYRQRCRNLTLKNIFLNICITEVDRDVITEIVTDIGEVVVTCYRGCCLIYIMRGKFLF